MISENLTILDCIYRRLFPSNHRLKDICWTFKKCSEDDKNDRYLVSSQIRTIKFEKLTEWIKKEHKQSADAMSFNESNIVLIEFKAGDKTKHSKTKEKLIADVIGKINDSDNTLFQDIVSYIDGIDTSKIKIAFYLVVDAIEMGIDSRSTALLQLSLGASILDDEKLGYLFNRLLPELRKNVGEPDHFSEIDIWYSDIFDTYLKQYGIIDMIELIDSLPD